MTNHEEEAERLKQQEADLVALRIRQLAEKPIEGEFDLDHLKGVHAHLFQDLPEHGPGEIRGDTEDWTKRRALEGRPDVYPVSYESQDIEQKLSTILEEFGGPDTIRGLSQEEASDRLAQLYGDLDHAHGFYEGNSRTLREFTRELACEAGFELDWTGTDFSFDQRDKLYLARDLAVMERAFPDVTPESAVDRRVYEAALVVDGLRRVVGDNDLKAIIRDGLSLSGELEHMSELERGRVPLMVFDAATGVLESAFDFACDFLTGGSPRSGPGQQSQFDEIIASRRAAAAIENMRDSIERGETLRAEDMQHLLPNHLENIRLRGDDYIRELVEGAERSRDFDHDHDLDL